MRANPHTQDVNFDWNEMSKAVRLEIDQDRARAPVSARRTFRSALQTLLVGSPVTQMREGDQAIDVVLRATPAERHGLSGLADINVPTASGKYVPLAQVAKIHYTGRRPDLAPQPSADDHRARRHP